MNNYFSNHISFWEVLSTLDIIVIIITLLITMLSVLYGHYIKKKSNEETNFLDMLILGRSLTMPMFVATLVATWYGGIFGVTEIAFNHGIYNLITQGIFWYLAYIIFALFIIKKIMPYKAITLPDLVNKMFGIRSAKITAIFNLLNVIPIAYTISIGLFLQLLFGGTLLFNMIGGISFVLFYSMLGGLRAVIFSDIIQFFIMCTSVFIILFISFQTFGGISFLQNKLPSSYFSPLSTKGLMPTITWALIALSTLIDPNFYQRCFAAKSEKVAKKGILISTFIWFLFDICTTFGAMYAKAVIPMANPKYAYLTYALQLLPDGIRGLIIAGILATILSTLDSYLFLGGSILSHDLGQQKYKKNIKSHYLGIIMIAGISVYIATIFNGNIKSVWKTLGSFQASCLLFPILYGYIFPKQIKDKQFVASSLLAITATSIWKYKKISFLNQNIDEIYIGILVSTCTLVSCHIYNKRLT